MRISAWAIRNPIPVALLMIALTLVGIAAYITLPVKRFPNVEFPIVVVSVTQSGASASEVETQITRPVEDALTGIAGMRHVTSTVTLGGSSTVAEFEIGSDMQKAVDDVRTAVEQARAVLPAGIDPPSVRRVDESNAPILTYAVSAPDMSAVELSFFVDDVIARALQAQRGVAQVSRIGGVAREINVILDPARLAASGVTAAAINNALSGFNVDEGGGRAGVGAREQTIRILGSSQDIDALSRVTVPILAGRYVRLSDLATIVDGRAEARGFARLDGRPVVAFQVTRTKSASDVSVEQAVDKEIFRLNAANPRVHISSVISTVKDTRSSYSATTHVLIEGMILAALVVLLFLGNWRATLIAAVAMPLSLVPTFAVMSVLGFSLNIITLLGLTLVIGILVDDAIVEVENIEKRIEAGATPYRASLLGADAIGLAVIATTSAIVVVFLPVSFMSGQIGQFFREFGLTVAVAVLFSLLVARLVTPVLAAYFLKPLVHQRPARAMHGHYAQVLNWALSHRLASVLIGALSFFGALALASSIPTGFQPVGDPGYLYLAVQGSQGATPDEMDLAVRDLSARLKANPQVERVFTQVGTSGSGNGSGPDTGTITIVLKDGRTVTTDTFQRSITGILREIPGVRITNQGSFGGAGVQIVLAGQDALALDRAQLQLLKEMRGLKSVLEPRPAPPAAGPELVIRPRPDAAAQLNVSSRAIAQTVRIATIGDIDANVAKFSAGRERLPIRVRLPNSARDDIAQIGNLQVPTLDGKTTPLDSVATLSLEAGPSRITRYDRERRVSVEADLNGVTLGQARQDIEQLPVMQNLPEGVSEAKTGDTEAMADLFGGIVGAMSAGILLIYAVLVLLFRSFFKPITILSALPLTLLGAFLALKLTGIATTLPVLIGLLMLLGLAAKNSILLVEFAIEDEQAGHGRREAIMNACRERSRPIIMTTVAMAAGMLPTALGIGDGAAFRQPMAVAVIGGLISSTLLSLILVPVVYEIVDGVEDWLRPRLRRLVTPRTIDDDAPMTDAEDRALRFPTGAP